MTRRFETFIPFILKHETVFQKGHYGDYQYAVAENDPDDPGGVTKFGIDFRAHAKRPWNMTADMIRKLSVEGATHIYWLHWVKDGIEEMPAKLGECFFNTAVMSGPSQAKLCLSRSHDAASFLEDYLVVLDKIVARRPRSEKFIRGWRNRIHNLAKFLSVEIQTKNTDL